MRLRKRDNLGPRSSPREQLAFSTRVLSDDTNYLGRALSPVWEFTCNVNRETGPDQKFISPLLVESASIVGSDWPCSKDGKRGRDWIKSQRKGWKDQCLVTKEDYVRKALQCCEFWRIFDTKKIWLLCRNRLAFFLCSCSLLAHSNKPKMLGIIGKNGVCDMVIP